MKKRLNTFIKSRGISFGDYILFQEYKQGKHDGEQYFLEICNPILVIYLGEFICDQTIGFNYVKWLNTNHSEKITNEYVTNHRRWKTVEEIDQHIEWMDYIDILGYWKHKPNWKEIMIGYRKMTHEKIIGAKEIDWSFD